MWKPGIGVAIAAALVALAGCATKERTIGMASGAAIGAAVSNGGTVGTLGGAMVGYGMGRAYEERHR
jgi:hypothetical protein